MERVDSLVCHLAYICTHGTIIHVTFDSWKSDLNIWPLLANFRAQLLDPEVIVSRKSGSTDFGSLLPCMDVIGKIRKHPNVIRVYEYRSSIKDTLETQIRSFPERNEDFTNRTVHFLIDDQRKNIKVSQIESTSIVMWLSRLRQLLTVKIAFL